MSEREPELKNLDVNQEAEKFVASEVKNGRVADLIAKFPNEEDRAIRATILQGLIFKGGHPVKGVWVKGAVVLGDLNLENVEMKSVVVLDTCEFKDNVSLSDASTNHPFSCPGSKFVGVSNFHRIRSKSSIFFDNAEFHRAVDFAGAHIHDQLSASGTTFFSGANFNGLKAGAVLIKGTIFKGIANFGGAKLEMGLDANPLKDNETKTIKKTEFKSAVSFNGLRVDGSLFITEVEFSGEVDFNGAFVGNQFVADGAKFIRKDATVYFTGMEVNGSVFIRNAEFKGPIDFTMMNVTGSVNLRNTIFHELCDFGAVEIRSRFSANGTVFKGKTNFQTFRVADSVIFSADLKFKASNAEFTDSVDFTTMEVGKLLDIRGVVFHRDVTFAGATIGGQLLANEAKFLFNEAEANFYGIRVGRGAFFRGTTFRGPVNIGSAKLEGILFEDLEDEEDEEDSSMLLILDRTEISLVLQFLRTKLGYLAMRDLKVGTVELVDTVFPELGNLHLQGMTYERIEIRKDEAQNLEFYREFLRRVIFSRHPYQYMADFFRKMGEIEGWRQILVDMHKREGSEKGFWGRLWSHILDETIGFGYRPGRVFMWSTIFIAIGTLAFNEWTVDPPPDSPSINPLNQLLYSLGLFIPVIKLPIIKAWEGIKYTHWTIWLFAHIQTILGWFVAGLGITSLARWLK